MSGCGESSLGTRESLSEEIKFKLKSEGGTGAGHWNVGREWLM